MRCSIVLMKNFSVLLLALPVCLIKVYGQKVNINLPVADEIFRRNQLMGYDKIQVSGTIKPYSYYVYDSAFTKDGSALSKWHIIKTIPFFKKGQLGVLPLVVQQQINTDHPFGWNDGAMIPSRGYQLYASGGVSVQYGPLHIDIYPEIVWGQNTLFDTLSLTYFNSYKVYVYYGLMINSIDNPIRFGKSSYYNLSWGQSAVSLSFKSMSVSVSTKNLWWGPGIVNSLIMSNNAPGFPHLSLNTIKPIKTPIGNFEGQIIAGLLKNSGITPFDPNVYYNGLPVYIPKAGNETYLNGIIITYQPKWIKGLFLGLTRVYNQFTKDAEKNHDYFPIFGNLFRSKDRIFDDLLRRDQLASVFFRYVFTKSHAEVYAEYGREDASYNLRDFLMTPQHSRAFIVGGQKLFSLKKQSQSILVQAEITQLQQAADYISRDSGPWYLHSQVTQGYTYKGKILGAGIGPGSNCRNIAVKWIRPNSIIGINLMQIDRNNDLYYELFTNPAINRKWTDNVIGLNGNFLYGKDKKIMINWNVDYIRTKNYHWLLDQYSPDDPANVKQYRNNWHIKIATIYKF